MDFEFTNPRLLKQPGVFYWLILFYAPQGAESQADNLVKSTVKAKRPVNQCVSRKGERGVCSL